MEEDIIVKHNTGIKTKTLIEKRLDAAIQKASEHIKYKEAHDEDLLRGLAIVREFIKKKKRVCYGGTAMNAILPVSKQFYDKNLDLPDYDFYTPDVDSDVTELVKLLKQEGFNDVFSKVGIHEGTMKVLVNYTPIADVSYIDPELFNVILRRSILKDGMHYTDEYILRMMMYLELSRPKGMPERWTKVFERLELINDSFPIKGCTINVGKKPEIPLTLRKVILDYIIEWKRILCNGPIVPLYRQGIRKQNAIFRIQEGGPILFTSPDPKIDSAELLKRLEEPSITLFRHRKRGEIIPERIELRQGKKTICVIIQEIACHSYVPFPTNDGRTIYLGSLEFLITLYLSLSIFTLHGEDVLGPRILCQVKEFIKIFRENYRAKNSQFEAFALQCRGHQPRFASLLRDKIKRQKEYKEKQKQRATQRASRSSSTRKKSATRKSARRNARTEQNEK
jgi:hypothetical protein